MKMSYSFFYFSDPNKWLKSKKLNDEKYFVATPFKISFLFNFLEIKSKINFLHVTM